MLPHCNLARSGLRLRTVTTIHDPDLALLVRAARSHDHNLRVWAANWLCRLMHSYRQHTLCGQRGALRDLAKQLVLDPHPAVVWAAASALGGEPCPAEADLIDQALHQLPVTPQTEPPRALCASLLAELRDDRLLEVLRTDPTLLGCGTRLHVLLRLGTPAALSMLSTELLALPAGVVPPLRGAVNLAAAEATWAFVWDRAEALTGNALVSLAVEMDVSLLRGSGGGSLTGQLEIARAVLQPVLGQLDSDPAAARAAAAVLTFTPARADKVPVPLRALTADLLCGAARRALELCAIAAEVTTPAARLLLMLHGHADTSLGSVTVSLAARNGLLSQLVAHGPEAELVTTCQAALAEPERVDGRDSPQHRAALLLSAWQVADPAVIDHLWGQAADYAEAAQALALLGEAALQRTEAALSQDAPPWDTIIPLLSELSPARSGALWAAHLPEVLARLGFVRGLAPILRLAPTQLVPVLRAALRPGEAELYTCYRWLCDVHHSQPVPAPEVEEGSPWRTLYTGGAREDGEPLLRLPLRCRAPGCGWVYQYYVRQLLYTVATERESHSGLLGPAIADRLCCKRCESLDTLELTPLALEMMKDYVSGQAIRVDPDQAGVAFGAVRVVPGRDGGDDVNRALLDYLGEQIAADPDNLAARLRRSRLLHHLRRDDEADIELLALLQREPAAVEARAMRMDIRAGQQDMAGVVREGEALLSLPEPVLLLLEAQQWARLRAHVVEQVRRLRQSGQLRGGRRADPKATCPCGSGRRYKSCCLGRDRAAHEAADAAAAAGVGAG